MPAPSAKSRKSAESRTPATVKRIMFFNKNSKSRAKKFTSGVGNLFNRTDKTLRRSDNERRG